MRDVGSLIDDLIVEASRNNEYDNRDNLAKAKSAVLDAVAMASQQKSRQKKPQAQYSLDEQLTEAIDLVTRAGLYDAADWIATCRKERTPGG